MTTTAEADARGRTLQDAGPGPIRAMLSLLARRSLPRFASTRVTSRRTAAALSTATSWWGHRDGQPDGHPGPVPTSKAGLSTGRSLPELCRERSRLRANLVLWAEAEVVAMATDLAEFVGAAVGLNLISAYRPAGSSPRWSPSHSGSSNAATAARVAVIALLALVGLGFLTSFAVAVRTTARSLAGWCLT